MKNILIAIMVTFLAMTQLAIVNAQSQPLNNYPFPTPYTTYHKGDSYTTVYQPSQTIAPNGTEPKIAITLPTNKTLIRTNNFTVTFSLSLEGLHPITLQELFYQTSWQSDNISIEINSQKKYTNETLNLSIPFYDVPEGQQSITVYADTMSDFQTSTESASKPVSGMAGIPPYGNYFYVYSNYYFISGQSSVNFTIDTSPTITPSPTSGGTPLNDYQALMIGIIVLLSVGVIALLLYRKHRKTSNLSR